MRSAVNSRVLLNLNFVRKQTMRYGENSHQNAAFYVDLNVKEAKRGYRSSITR